MKISSRACGLILFLGTATLISGCNSQKPNESAEIANPASEHCVKKGGRVQMVKGAAGEKGMCHLPDGTVVEEWELFRQDNPNG